MQWLTLPAYIIHWIAVSVWVGGVIFAIYMLRKHRDTLQEWLSVVSRAAIWSVIALAVTGMVNAVVYLPSFEYVYGTPWGRWLLIKLGAVVLVLLIAYFVRRAWKKRGSRIGRLLKLELTALAAVLLIVGALTSRHPTPHEEPLNWHVMGADIHMTLQVTPNQPGTNSFVVKVWLPDDQSGPQSVTLTLQRGDDPPRSVNLTPVENEYVLTFPGFTEHRFRGQGTQLDRPGTWTARVIVTDEHGKVTEYEREFEAW
jgi:copper transport protein